MFTPHANLAGPVHDEEHQGDGEDGGADKASNVLEGRRKQMEAEALFNTIDTLGDGNGTLELYEVVLYVQVSHAPCSLSFLGLEGT